MGAENIRELLALAEEGVGIRLGEEGWAGVVPWEGEESDPVLSTSMECR